ncbi:MAG: AAA family ATPase [Actinomycetota bacterium]
MTICPNCREENPERAKFCLSCATPLAEASLPRATRKTVTVVFCDVTGSTRLGEQLDPETLRGVMGRYFDAMRTVIEKHGGTVEKFIGDAVMAVFGIPTLHEDDALRAVRAAVDMRDALADLNQQLTSERGVAIEVRTGVNTGQVVAGDPAAGQALVTGDAVNVAARLEQAARPGETLIGLDTYRLVRDAVELEEIEALALKGKSEPVPAYRLLAVRADVEGFARRLDAPLVGRDYEVGLLRQAYERSVRERSSHLFTVLGAAGVGKSRLTTEFLSAVDGEALVIQGRCLNYGEAITFYPVREAVKQAAGIGEEESLGEVLAKLEKLVLDEEDRVAISEQLAQMMGFSEGAASTEEIFWSVRRLFEALARERPLVVVFDDIHWGEPTFLDLIEHIADLARDASILLLVVARPELLDLRPGWAGGKLNATSILLEPLSEAEVSQLVVHLLGEVELAADVKDRITTAAEGNPLFVEQMLAMLLDEERIRRSNGSWVAVGDLSEIAVPPTVHALIASRLDRLGTEERQVIERASVVGKVFYRGAIAELSPPDQRSHLSDRLIGLVRKELIRPERAEFAGQDGFRFRHVLIRDAAYDAMPKQTRAELHERFAGWFEGLVGDRIAEYEEIVGHHLEQAYLYRQELGPSTAEHKAIGERAGRRLARAGHRAFTRGDIPAATKLLGRAIEVTSDELVSAHLQLDLAEAQIEAGDFSSAARAVDAVEAGAGGDASVRGRAQVLAASVRLQVASYGAVDDLEPVVQALIPSLEEVGDHRTLAKAYRMLATIANLRCDAAALRRWSERALEHARIAGDAWEESESIPWIAMSRGMGLTPLDECNALLEDLLDGAHGQPKLTALLGFGLGEHLIRSGRMKEGVELLDASRAAMRDMGMTLWWAATSIGAGAVMLDAGDLDRAEAALREGYGVLAKAGEKAFLSTVASTLGAVLYEQGRWDDALEFALIAREAGASDDLFTQVEADTVEAMVLARKGRLTEAEGLARAAVARGAPSDYMAMRADPLVALGEVLALAGKRDEAAASLAQALELYRAKKDVLMTAKVAKRLADLTSG